MGKVWWKSKTVWFNGAMGLAAVATELVPIIDHLTTAGYEADWVAPVRAGVAFAAISGNMVLRSITSEPVTFRKGGADA